MLPAFPAATLPGIVDNRGNMARYRPPDRARLDRHDARVRAEHEVAFGLTEHFVDR